MYGNIEINIVRGKRLIWVLAACDSFRLLLPIYEKLRTENASTQQSMQATADYSSEDLHRHAAVTAALWWWTPIVAGKEEAAIYLFQKLSPTESTFVALTETCSWRHWTSEHTHANSCWKALLGDHPCYRANHTFCCLNTDLKAKSEALSFEAGRPQTGAASWTTCNHWAGYAWPGFLCNKNKIGINFIEDIHDDFRNRFLCFKHTAGLVVLKIPSE